MADFLPLALLACIFIIPCVCAVTSSPYKIGSEEWTAEQLEKYCKSITHRMIVSSLSPIFKVHLRKMEESLGITRSEKKAFIFSSTIPSVAISRAKREMPQGSTDIETIKAKILNIYATNYFDAVASTKNNLEIKLKPKQVI
jgi:hypothetical protein